MKRESGFSLMELAFVILIMTALVLISVGGWMSFIPGYRLNAAAGDLQCAIEIAKLKAIRENSVVTVNLSVGTAPDPPLVTYVAFIDDNGDGVQAPGDQTIVTKTFHEGISRHGSSDVQVRFNARGFPDDPSIYPRELRIVTDQKGRGVQVTPAGGTILRESSNGGTIWQDVTY